MTFLSVFPLRSFPPKSSLKCFSGRVYIMITLFTAETLHSYHARKNVKLSRNPLQGKKKKDPVFRETERKEESSGEETTHYSVRRRDESNLELPRELCHVRLQEGVSLACHSKCLKILTPEEDSSLQAPLRSDRG